jgi:hypothetical protein
VKLTDLSVDIRQRDTSPDTDVTAPERSETRVKDPVHRAVSAGCEVCRSNPRHGFVPPKPVYQNNRLYSANGRVCDCLVRERLRALQRSLDLPRCHYETRRALTTRLQERLIIRGGEWTTVREYVSAAVICLALPAMRSDAAEFSYPRVHISDLYEVIATSIYMGKEGMPPSDLLVIRVNIGYTKHAAISSALGEVLHRCRRQAVWLVDEPRERFGPGDAKLKIPPHRAWSEDVAHLIDELGYIEVKDLSPTSPLDLTALRRLPPRPIAPPVPALPAYVHPDPSVVFFDGNVPTSRTDAAGMLAPRPRGAGPAGASRGLNVPSPPEDEDDDLIDLSGV